MERHLRPVIPEPLMIDTFGGKAWIGVIPFTIWRARPVFLPSFPGISNFHWQKGHSLILTELTFK